MTEYSAYRGLRVRGVGDRRTVTAYVGAMSYTDARTRATDALTKRGLQVEYLQTEGGERLKVGIIGLRRFGVVFREL